MDSRKKYRKMRMKFDEVMRQSDELYVEEQLAIETAKRLAQENEFALPFLLYDHAANRHPTVASSICSSI